MLAVLGFESKSGLELELSVKSQASQVLWQIHWQNKVEGHFTPTAALCASVGVLAEVY